MLGGFLFGIGLLFLLMHIRQRINCIRFLRDRIGPIERALRPSAAPFEAERFGADFYLGLIFIFINSAWLAASTYFLWQHLSTAIGAFCVGFVIQFSVRAIALCPYETTANPAPAADAGHGGVSP
jgi:hypothetical protein